MYYLARLGVEICTPLIMALILLLLSILLTTFNRKQLGLLSSVVGVAILLFFGYGGWSSSYIKTNERAHEPLTTDFLLNHQIGSVNYIAVLGSGHVSESSLPVTSQIGGASLYRIVEAKRLSKLLPKTDVIILGGIGYDPIPNARIVEQVALLIDIPPQRIITREDPRDTEQEAFALFEIVREEPFVLVTSANHMNRAISLCERLGMNPIPAPTDYIIKNHHVRPAANVLPSPQNLALARSVIYENLGILWIRIKQMF